MRGRKLLLRRGEDGALHVQLTVRMDKERRTLGEFLKDQDMFDSIFKRV